MKKLLPEYPIDKIGKWPVDTWMQRRLREVKFKELGLEGKVVSIDLNKGDSWKKVKN